MPPKAKATTTAAKPAAKPRTARATTAKTTELATAEPVLETSDAAAQPSSDEWAFHRWTGSTKQSVTPAFPGEGWEKLEDSTGHATRVEGPYTRLEQRGDRNALQWFYAERVTAE